MQFTHEYPKNGAFWFPVRDDSVNDVRIVGTTEMQSCTLSMRRPAGPFGYLRVGGAFQARLWFRSWQRSFGCARFQFDWKARWTATKMLRSGRLTLANEPAIHGTVAQRHRQNDEGAGNHRRTCSRDIEVAATRPMMKLKTNPIAILIIVAEFPFDEV